MIKIINGQRAYFRHLSEDTEEVVEDSMLHEHQDGTVHSHEGGDVDHEHEENLDEQDNEAILNIQKEVIETKVANKKLDVNDQKVKILIKKNTF